MASTSRDRLLHVFDREQDYGLIQTLTLPIPITALPPLLMLKS